MGRETIDGATVGLRLAAGGAPEGKVIHVRARRSPSGPEQNAFVFLDLAADLPRARYLAWVNLFDVEHAARRQAGRWRLCEPAQAETLEAEWRPFGWGDAAFPSVADAHVAEDADAI
ncbi:MAG: hypothetical protein Q8Q88_06540 [Phenylobacterium sp.]|uniref:hypothetical protein n=1 Tax=Phenylobacterium sp. TaxID=1871053 RepID=UPI002733FCCC|nr:hypothetical protein [Phenylobacterium sp.]MDP3746692.1 hypothetical protein [Phenylobacterium sp.]